jgi:4-hydroxy-tetrahydrodipicolinate reductase
MENETMINVIVTGAAGKMGSRIIQLIGESETFKLRGAVERKEHPRLGSDAGEVAGTRRLGVPIHHDLEGVLKETDVVMDFTAPASTVAILPSVARAKKPIVIGTTGFSKKEMDILRDLVRPIACVLSPNMSVGVNLLFKILADVARVTGDDYDVEIVETHHRFKKDAPSGTALAMAQVLAEVLKRDLGEVGVYSRAGITGERKRKEIGIQSVRAGDVVGEHTVIFGGLGERIEITHKAHSRDNFARGALLAAQWVVSRKPGLYDMQDVLGLRGR